MKYHEQTDAFALELDNLINRFKDEFDLNLQTVIGVLETKKIELTLDCGVEFDMDPGMLDEDEDDDGDDEQQSF